MSRIVNNSIKALACLIACPVLLGAQGGAGDSNDQVFNAVDGIPHELMVAVGNGGLIVHFASGEKPRRMPSGTNRDLLDVHVAAKDFAIAVGQGVVLLWDGKTWTPIVEEEDAAPNSQAWASPDHQFFIYGQGESGVYRLCPRLRDAAHQPFCRQFPALLLAACGQGDLMTLVLANGEFYRVNNALIGTDGGFEPLFRPMQAIELKSAWLPDGRCNAGGGLPEAFAVNSGGQLVHFDAEAWRAMEKFSEAGVAAQLATRLQSKSLQSEWKHQRAPSGD